MSIILSWTRKDADAILNNYEVYRALDKDKATLFAASNKIATLANKAQVQYEDLTTSSNVPYWYAIRSKTIYGDIDSTPVMLVECTQPGVGNLAPMIGDFADGFVQAFWNEQAFTAAAQKIITAQLVKNWTDAANGDYTTYPVANPAYDSSLGSYCVNKFWKNGKLIFVPNYPTTAIKSMTVQQAYDTIITPLVLAKPQVEINGVVYEFGILGYADAVIYIASGNNRTLSDLITHYTRRTTPKTYIYTNPTQDTFRLMCGDLGAGGPAFNGNTSTPFAALPGTTALAANAPISIPWFFTPVNA